MKINQFAAETLNKWFQRHKMSVDIGMSDTCTNLKENSEPVGGFIFDLRNGSLLDSF